MQILRGQALLPAPATYDGNDDRGGLGDDDNDGDELTSCCVLYGSAAGQVTCDRSYMQCIAIIIFLSIVM